MTEQNCVLPGAEKTNRHLGLLAILGTWTTWFIWIGAVKGLAVMLPTLRDQLNTYTWVIGWIIVIMEVTADITGPLASVLRRHLGIRVCVMMSGLMISAAFIIASLSETLVMAVVLAVLAGPGLGIPNILCRELIASCFSSTEITYAYTLSQTGGAIAYMVMPPLSKLFLDTYGWRDSMLLLGAIFCHMTVCGALLRTRSNDDTKFNKEASEYSLLLRDQRNQQGKVTTEMTGLGSRVYLALKSSWQSLNTCLFGNVSYWLLATQCIIAQFGNLAWLVYFVPHTESKGFSSGDAVAFTVIVGGARLFGGFFVVPALEKFQIAGNKVLLGMAFVALTAYYVIDPWLVSYWLNVANLIMYGFSLSIVWVLVDVCLCEVVGVDRLGSALGWIAMKSSILRFSLLYLPGLIYDIRGSYTLAFLFLSGIHVLAFVALLLLAWLQRKN